MKINDIIIKPLLTEKATELAQKKVYLFQVSQKANKFQIKEAAEKLFSVKVSEVSVMNRKGKTKRVGKRMKSKQRPDRKLALIRVSEGHISVFPQP